MSPDQQNQHGNVEGTASDLFVSLQTESNVETSSEAGDLWAGEDDAWAEARPRLGLEDDDPLACARLLVVLLPLGVVAWVALIYCLLLIFG